jgi:hypothetical protein
VFRKLDRFLFSGEWEIPTLLGLLERINPNHWTVHVSITNQVSETLCSLFFRVPNDVQKPSNFESAGNITSG